MSTNESTRPDDVKLAMRRVSDGWHMAKRDAPQEDAVTLFQYVQKLESDLAASPAPAVPGVPTARPAPFTEEQVMRWHDASGTGPYWRTHARDIAEMLNARDRATALRHAEEVARVRREALEEVAKQILEARGPSSTAATGYTDGVWRGYDGALDIVRSLAPIPPARGGR